MMSVQVALFLWDIDAAFHIQGDTYIYDRLAVWETVSLSYIPSNPLVTHNG